MRACKGVSLARYWPGRVPLPSVSPSMIRSATSEDAAGIAAIYNHYVMNTIATFEEEPVPESEMQARIDRGLPHYPWLVAEADGALAGYAYASSWIARAGYRSSVQTSVYVDKDLRKAGYGSALYRLLLDRLRSRGLHCALGVIALPNPDSVALHEKFGFRKVGELREVGRKLDRWIDVGYWQLLL